MIKPLLNYEKQYYMLSNGKIWSRKRKSMDHKLSYGGYTIYGGKFLKSHHDKRTGYLQICLCKDGVRKYYRIHRLAAQHFISNPLNKPQINHKDGNKLNNDYTNLEWVTDQENRNHSRINGLMSRGENHFRSKLKESQVKEIRKNHINRKRGEKTWEKYNISKPNYYDIIRKRSWKWLGDE